jgi:hypothetical protein
LSSQLGNKIKEERAGADVCMNLGEDVIIFGNGCGLDIGRICSKVSAKLSVSACHRRMGTASKVVVGNMNGYRDHTLSQLRA